MNMRLTEEERREILSRYKDDTSEELLTHLKRHFPTYETNLDWMENQLKFIKIDDKVRPLESNKKYLVNKIYNLVVDNWIGLGEQKIRRTIKKYLDGIMN